jgi:hypothetical protein
MQRRIYYKVTDSSTNEYPCRNCNATRFGIKSRGLCKRCFGATYEIEKLQGWNPKDESTLRAYPRGLPLLPPPLIARMRDDVIQQWKERLRHYQLEEKWRDEIPSSLSIEYKLQWLALRAGVRNSDFLHGLAACFDDYTPGHRKKLWRILKSIEEHLRPPPIQWGRFFVIECTSRDDERRRDNPAPLNSIR